MAEEYSQACRAADDIRGAGGRIGQGVVRAGAHLASAAAGLFGLGESRRGKLLFANALNWRGNLNDSKGGRYDPRPLTP